MNKKLSRVALFWGTLGGGGVERVMLSLAEAFLERGIETDIILMEKKGERSEQVPTKAQIFDLEAHHVIMGPLKVARYLRQRRPSVLLSAGYTNRIALIAHILSGVFTTVVISEHCAVTVSNSNSSLPDWILDHLSRWMYPLADDMIAVSEGVAEDVSRSLGFSRDEFEVIYNPVIGPDTLELAEQTVEHPWFGNKNPPVILGVGRLVEQKGFSTLLQAFARVIESRRARLVILGEGEKRPVLEQKAQQLGVKDAVHLPGFVSNPLKYMANASVFVLSSRWEGLGNVVVEALACGTPVVSTDCPSGPAEILKRGKYGKLVPVEDVSALAKGIEEALDGNVEPAPRSAVARFRRDRVADQYLDILSSVA